MWSTLLSARTKIRFFSLGFSWNPCTTYRGFSLIWLIIWVKLVEFGFQNHHFEHLSELSFEWSYFSKVVQFYHFWNFKILKFSFFKISIFQISHFDFAWHSFQLSNGRVSTSPAEWYNRCIRNVHERVSNFQFEIQISKTEKMKIIILSELSYLSELSFEWS